jgi:hypothetical protein
VLIAFLLVFLLGCIIAVFFSFNALYNTLKHGLPFVSTPRWAINWLRDNLELNENDIVYELGCGSALMLAALAKKHPTTKFVGIEVQWWPYTLAKWRARNCRNVQIIYGDIFHHDLAAATVVYGFFITGFMPKLADKLTNSLHPGTKVISYGFSLPGWKTIEEIPNPKKPTGSRILVYRR